ncbi:unnamed protein product [Rotaria sp. Silwood1]|nr:unnamed protein product [Rotaria sp. Silwood1]CAF1099342.1 unnamed protein product [Rotaria sp. Silwood1]CAF3442106.1 unnamed protein product [Rotaria sp. Silwood1]CAF3442794.1 unnamed protein product [Rotaria sp. Silwood1]
MLKSQSTETVNTRSDGEFCRNACGFYGNKIWDGFCSKCYREVYQQAKQIQQAYDGKLITPISNSTPPLSPSLSNLHEKRRSNITMPNPIRQMVNRAGNLRSSSSSVISALINDEQAVEQEIASKHLDIMTTDDARIDIKSQVKTFANNFHKKCSNKNIHLDTLIQDYGTFKDTLKKRIQTNSIYRDENEDLIHRIRDYVESIIFSKNYSLIFNRIAIEYEEQDLSIQNRISSLHWVTPTMLDTVLNEDIPNVRETIYKAMNALIELDAKTTPQGKIHSIMECKSFIEQALQSSSGITINADCFLPALIYVVLKAKPPRLHSNIQFLSNFSQPNGEQLYYLANLDSAVRFIGLLEAEHLGLSSNDFSLYMRGEPVLPSKIVSLFDYPLKNNSNIQKSRELFIQYDQIEYNCEKFNENMLDFNRRLSQTVTDINELLNGSYARFSYFEQMPQSAKRENNDKKVIDILDQSTINNEHLPEPLSPEILIKQNIQQ